MSTRTKPCAAAAGAVLTRANLNKVVFPNPSQYKTARYPSIILTTDEVQEVKTVQPRGAFSCPCCRAHAASCHLTSLFASVPLFMSLTHCTTKCMTFGCSMVASNHLMMVTRTSEIMGSHCCKLKPKLFKNTASCRRMELPWHCRLAPPYIG